MVYRNAFSAGAPLRTPLRELTALPNSPPLSWIGREEGDEGRERKGEKGGEERGGKIRERSEGRKEEGKIEGQ